MEKSLEDAVRVSRGGPGVRITWETAPRGISFASTADGTVFWQFSGKRGNGRQQKYVYFYLGELGAVALEDADKASHIAYRVISRYTFDDFDPELVRKECARLYREAGLDVSTARRAKAAKRVGKSMLNGNPHEAEDLPKKMKVKRLEEPEDESEKPASAPNEITVHFSGEMAKLLNALACLRDTTPEQVIADKFKEEWLALSKFANVMQQPELPKKRVVKMEE